MLRPFGSVHGCVVVAALGGVALDSIDAFAQDCCLGGSATGVNAWTNGLATSAQWPATTQSSANMAQSPANADPVPDWWYHGDIEAGGRFFLNNPSRNGARYLGQGGLAKFYEYSTVMPGAFGGGHIAAGSKDGLYGIDLWANNIGYSDQSYFLNASKIGEQYISLGWDQTPHVYSTSAQTPYSGVGSNALTLPPGLLSNTAHNSSIINPYLQQTDIGIERDTASVNYRWRPTDAWDVRAKYSHMSRTGTQVDGVTGFAPAGGSAPNSPTEVTKPVDDTTQNFGVNGEYVGTSPWNQRFTFKVAYNGSVYNDNHSSYTVQNPYCTGATASSCANKTESPFAQLSLPPSNQANAVSETLAAELPFKSRYVGTLNYVMMTQNGTFQPMTDNPNAVTSPSGVPWNSIGALPATSLNGAINTTLSNNILTTQIARDLKSKLSYRYYNFENNTQQITFPSWVSYDQTGSSHENTISSLAISYVKQNAGAELNWRPSPDWNFTSGYG